MRADLQVKAAWVHVLRDGPAEAVRAQVLRGRRGNRHPPGDEDRARLSREVPVGLRQCGILSQDAVVFRFRQHAVHSRLQ